MQISAFLVVMVTWSTLLPNVAPTWHQDYMVARRLAKEQAKPLAVVIGHGPMGWQRLSAEGRLSHEVELLLARNYVCAFIDMTSESSSRLAAEFDMPSGLGLVISSHGGELQAFRHDGPLTNEQSMQKLAKYMASDRTVTTTETDSVHRVSFAAPEPPPMQHQAQPVFDSTPVQSTPTMMSIPPIMHSQPPPMMYSQPPPVMNSQPVMSTPTFAVPQMSRGVSFSSAPSIPVSTGRC